MKKDAQHKEWVGCMTHQKAQRLAHLIQDKIWRELGILVEIGGPDELRWLGHAMSLIRDHVDVRRALWALHEEGWFGHPDDDFAAHFFSKINENHH